MKFFNKQEIKIVGTILLFIFVISFFNFRISIRRARDNRRKNDLAMLQEALINFNHVFGKFPESLDGKILSCRGENTFYDEKNLVWVNLEKCEWGEDSLYDYREVEGGEIFLKPIPTDPKDSDGILFMYLSNGNTFQLLGSLEGTDEAEYDPLIEKRGIMCGTKVCNYGRAYGNTPLDKSIEEYENEIKKKIQ